MNRPEPDSPAAARRSAVAADWLVRRDRGLTATEQDEFLQWLAADPRHGEWFALHRATVGDFSALAHWRPEHAAEPNPDLLAPPRRRISWLVPALAAAAAIALSVVVWRRAAPLAPPAQAASAELERRILEDGTAVELNHGAVVTTAFTASERRAVLERGEAYFTIAKNPARPFIVRAAGVDVRAVGTAFRVRLDPAAVEVVVTEGRVALARTETSEPKTANGNQNPSSLLSPPSSALPPPSSVLDAGQRATVSLAQPDPPQIAPATPAQITRHLNWQPQLLDFSSAPLAVAVAEFNRRNHVQFTLADPELAALPIVASIRSDNIEGFAKFLAAAPGVTIERRSPDEIVVHRKR